MDKVDFDDRDIQITLGKLFNSITGQYFLDYIDMKLEKERRWLEKDISIEQTNNIRGRVQAYRSIQNFIHQCIENHNQKIEETLNREG